MKRLFSARRASVFGAASIAVMGFGHAEDCKSIGSEVSKAIAEEPAKVLVVVDSMIAAHEDCACDIVKAAIAASSADKQLVREIVVTAATAAPSAAASIAECAVAEAPEAATQIKAGLTEVFAGAKSGGGKSVVYDDSYSAKGGKTVIEDVADDFGPEPVVISGVYLIAPSASSSADSELLALSTPPRSPAKSASSPSSAAAPTMAAIPAATARPRLDPTRHRRTWVRMGTETGMEMEARTMGLVSSVLSIASLASPEHRYDF